MNHRALPAALAALRAAGCGARRRTRDYGAA